MKKLLLIFVNAVFFIFNSLAQGPPIQWQKSFGGFQEEFANAVALTSDGGYISAGYSYSNSGDISGHHGFTTKSDMWVVKVDANGTLQWQKSLGGSDFDVAKSIEQTADGGYIIGGYAFSFDGDATWNEGQDDFWMVKLDAAGNIQWQKSFGGPYYDMAYSVKQTPDGGYIAAGQNNMNGGDVTGNHGFLDFWVVKMDATGTLQWQKSFGGSADDIAHSIQQTPDGGYIVAGTTESNDGDVTANHGGKDCWLVKLDGSGTLQWQHTYGSSGTDEINAVDITTDGGYIFSGYSSITDGDVTVNNGSEDFWIVKLDGSGSIQWQKAMGGSGPDISYSVQQTSDGGYVTAGATYSNDGDVLGTHGSFPSYEGWVLKFNTAGTYLWQKTLGGSNHDYVTGIRQTTSGDYIVAGGSLSSDGDLTLNHGNYDFWMVKMGCSSSASISQSSCGSFTLNSQTYTTSGTYTQALLNSTGCDSTLTITLTINPPPSVTVNAIIPLINMHAAPVTLSANPAGGTFSGAGVSGNVFNPTTAGLGTRIIQYSYTNGNACTGTSATSTIVYDTLGTVCTSYDTLHITDMVHIIDTVHITDTVHVVDTMHISVTDTLIINAVITAILPPNNVNTITIFPNPGSDHVIIDNGNFAMMNGYQIRIENSLGQQVFYSLINQQQFNINLSGWTGPGTYFVSILDNLNAVIDTRKIILQ